MQEVEKLGSLEQTGALRLLVTLLKNDALPVSELIKVVGCSQHALYNAIETLLEAGLIYEAHEKSFPRRRIFRLTEKGRKVAEKLLEIEEIMKG